MPWIEREGLAGGDPGAARVMDQLRAETAAQSAERI